MTRFLIAVRRKAGPSFGLSEERKAEQLAVLLGQLNVVRVFLLTQVTVLQAPK